MSDYKTIKERHNQSKTDAAQESICNRDRFSVKLQVAKTEYRDLLDVAQAGLYLWPFHISMM